MNIGWRPLKSETFTTFTTTFEIAIIRDIKRSTCY